MSRWSHARKRTSTALSIALLRWLISVQGRATERRPEPLDRRGGG
ncbi:hypothetical protein ACFYY8_10115 [Streptosporangium sp. NPDC001559]